MQTALPSPCISICQIDPHSGQCVGCYRSRKEIASWSSLSHEEQAALLDELRDRRAEQTGVKRRPTRRRAG
jgi:predicted Fe-S protein YdhL (DUF1289 family)